MMLLKTNNLIIGYGDKALATDINLQLEEEQLVGLIGQNGVGKSTLLRTLNGFQRQLAGEIEVMGIPSDLLTSHSKARKIAVVLTEKPTAQNLTVFELITIGRYPYSGWLGQLSEDDHAAIEQAIEDCQIHYLLNKRLYELSDGQLQKVMIARALAQDTNILFLDEPTSHLDLRNKSEVLELLKEITKSGKGIIISTHEINLAAKVCDEFWGMDFNEPLLVGKPSDLIKSGKVEKLLHLKAGVL